MALLLLFILILSTTSTGALQCLPGEGLVGETKRRFYVGGHPGEWRRCRYGKEILTYDDCVKAAWHIYPEGPSVWFGRDPTVPQGCTVRLDLNILFYYNPERSPFGHVNNRNFGVLCVEDTEVPSVCPIDTYSLGGECANCTKCPPERPFTCDRIGCTVTGATSNVTCGAGPVCSPGSSLQDQTLQTEGRCVRDIHSAEECKERATALGLDFQGVNDRVTRFHVPDANKGCYYNAVNKFLEILNTRGNACSPSYPCLCASKACTECSPGFYSESGANCVACPPSRPYTGSDGKTMGSTSLSACQADITCKPGYTLSRKDHPTKVCTKCPFSKPLTNLVGKLPQCTGDFSCPPGEEGVGYAGGDLRSYGQCEEIITDESDCRQAALYQNKMNENWAPIIIENNIDDGLRYNPVFPKGCYVSSDENKLYFNSNMTNLGKCSKGRNAIYIYGGQCLCARTQNFDMPCKTCAEGRYSPARTRGYLNVTCQHLPVCGTNGRFWQIPDRYRKTKSCPVDYALVSIIVVIFSICIWRCSVWYRKNEYKRANSLFRKDMQNIAELDLRTVSIDRYEPPLLSNVTNVDEGAPMNAALHDDPFTYLKTGMLSATNSAELVSLFKTTVSMVDRSDDKEAFVENKQALLSIVAVIRRRTDPHSGNALWTKEVAHEFRKVLSYTSCSV